jgi:hypothetical protein
MWTGSRLEPEARTERLTFRLTPTELAAIEQFEGTLSDTMRRIVAAGIIALAADQRRKPAR